MTPLLAAVAAAAVTVAAGARPRAAHRLVTVTRSHGDRRGPALVLLVLLAGAALVSGVRPVVVVAGAAAVAVLRWASARRSRRHVGEARRAAVPDLVHVLAAELETGATAADALSAAAAEEGPLSGALASVAGAVRAGAPVAEELTRLAADDGCERVRFVAAAWAVGETVGARIAPVLRDVADAFAADDDARRELAALLAGPRATVVLLAALPVFGVALGQSIGAHPLHLLLHRPLGWLLVAAAATLDMLGVLWTVRVTRSALRSR